MSEITGLVCDNHPCVGGKKRSVQPADVQMHQIRRLFKRSVCVCPAQFRTTLDWFVPAGSGESRFGPVTVAATELRLAAQILT